MKVFSLFLKLTLAILLSLPGRIQAESIADCHVYLSALAIGGSKLSSLPIESVVYERSTEHFYADKIPGYDPDALYVGVQNSSNGSHHYYLVIRNLRYEIKATFSTARLKSFKDIPLMTKGVLFELKIGPELADELVKSFAPKFQVDCLHAICRPLGKAGISFFDGKTPVRAATFDSALLQGKFYRHDGSQIPIRMLYENQAEVNHFVHKARTSDAAVLSTWGNYSAYALAPPLIVGALVLLVRPQEQDQDEKKREKAKAQEPLEKSPERLESKPLDIPSPQDEIEMQ